MAALQGWLAKHLAWMDGALPAAAAGGGGNGTVQALGGAP